MTRGCNDEKNKEKGKEKERGYYIKMQQKCKMQQLTTNKYLYLLNLLHDLLSAVQLIVHGTYRVLFRRNRHEDVPRIPPRECFPFL
jgi:hypothetical protein